MKKHTVFIEYKNCLYQLKKGNKKRMPFDACKKKCDIKVGTKACDNIFAHHCGDHGFFRRVAE